MPRKTKYASDLKPKDYTFHPSKPFQLSLSKLKEIYPDALNNCHLVALDQRQINVLLAMASVFPKFYWVWGLKSPQSSWDQATWDLWAEIETFVSEMETCLMSGCDLNEWLKQQRMLTAAIVGEAVDLTDPLQLSPDAVDFTAGSATPGLVPKIDQMLNVDRSLYADMNIAEVLFEGLIGRKISIPIPYEGTGIADIADEQLQILHNRFRMADSSLFNPLNDEKNITEALETLLRRDKFTDLEFLTPNLVTVLENLFQLGGGSAILGLISGLYEWITGEPLVEIPETATTAEILMLIANAKEKASTEPQPITVETTTNVTTTCKCGGGCGCGGGSEPPSEPAIEGDPPPTGWIEPTDDTGTAIVPGQPEYQTRKCKAANAVHEHLKNAMDKIKDVNFWGIGLDAIATFLGALWLIAIRALLLSALGNLGRLAGLAESAAGWLDELAQSLIENGVDLNILHQALVDNEPDLVCALYNATSMLEAITSYTQVLDDAGIDAVNQSVVEAFLTADLLNIVYFERENFEAALDGYTGPVDCAGCAPGFILVNGILSAGDLAGASFTIDAEQLPNNNDTYYQVLLTTPSAACTDITYNMSAQNTVGCAALDFSVHHWRYICGDADYTYEPEDSLYPATGAYCLQPSTQLMFRSCAPFSVTIDNLGGCA